MVNLYKKLGKRLKKAKEELAKSKPEQTVETVALADIKKGVSDLKESFSEINPVFRDKSVMPIGRASMLPTLSRPTIIQEPIKTETTPRKVAPTQGPKIIVQPPTGPSSTVASPGGAQIMKGSDVNEQYYSMEEELSEGFKYKPISLDVPAEFESSGKAQAKAKEYIERLKKIDDTFPLIDLTVKGKKVTVSWGQINWSEKLNNIIYSVNEPQLTDKLKSILNESKILLRQKLDIDFTKIRVEKAYEYLMKQFSSVIGEISKDIEPKERIILEYYVFRDFIGLSRIEPLLHDENIEDIHCDGFNIPLFITHRNPLYGELQTNIIFKTKESLNSFVLRLAQKCGKALSIAEPLMDGSLPDGSRVQVTYGTDIAMRGSNFTIRKFTEKPITPIDEINFGTVSTEICAYLWMATESGMSMLVTGSTATGKTSFLNALSLFIKPELKIISIEDTPELRLPHPNWIPEVARGGFGIKGYGEVTMFDLLKSALRQRPNYVIVGEVRGKEAYVMFQGMATGHPGLGTLHADSMSAVIDRLTNEPINLPKPMLENLDLIVFLTQTKRKGEYVRRVNEIVEVVGYNPKNRALITNRSFKWDPEEDKFVLLRSVLLDKIRERMGYTVDDLKADLVRRIKLLNWLKENNITDYQEVARYFKIYISNPEEIEKLVRRTK